MKYIVKNIDVDGSSSRSYKSLAGAVKRLEEMSGFKVNDVIEENFAHVVEAGGELPKIEGLKHLSAVGHFGNRVILSKVES